MGNPRQARSIARMSHQPTQGRRDGVQSRPWSSPVTQPTMAPDPTQGDIHLAPALKHLIATPRHAEPALDLSRLARVFTSIHHAHDEPSSGTSSSVPTDGTHDTSVHGVWLVILTGALFAVNALEGIQALYAYAVAQARDEDEVRFVAERMREVGLKTISFMGVPRASSSVSDRFASLPFCVGLDERHYCAGHQLSCSARGRDP